MLLCALHPPVASGQETDGLNHLMIKVLLELLTKVEEVCPVLSEGYHKPVD